MATKTISLEIDAYDRLKRARRFPSESFSSVVRRAVFPGDSLTGADLLARMADWRKEGRALLTEAELDRLDEAQRDARSSDSHWVRS
jgi:predicted CopG family antitoxin